MGETQYFDSPQGRRLAYHLVRGSGPTIVFMGGFKSEMEGTKAVHLQAWCESQGRAFLRFDYSGHGESSGVFTEGTIGQWADDAMSALDALTEGPLLLVGSSMGGWIALLAAKARAERIAGMVTIAAAPDFTEDSLWAGFSDAQKAELEDAGQVALPSDYGEPYIFTKALVEDGRKQLVLRTPLELAFPVRFLQGTADADVDMSVALRLLEHATGPDMRLVLLKDGDHRFSDSAALQLIEDAITNVLQVIE